MASQDGTAEILAVEAAREAALLNRDHAALRRLMSDDLSFTHGNGVVEDKETYLERVQAGEYRYLAIQRRDDFICVRGSLAVVTGHRSVKVHPPSEPAPVTVESQAVCVWAREPGGWRLLVYQGTFTAPPA